MALSDRILVMYEGEIVGELDPRPPPCRSWLLYGGRQEGGKVRDETG